MDKNTPSSLSLMLTQHPAHIITAPEEVAISSLISALQNHFCLQQGCGHCSACTMIRKQQHTQVCWITPQRSYTLDDLHPIEERIRFTLESHEHVFFIVTKADFLSTLCANRLLKSVEEPPAGYHFVFLATRLEAVLPTIRSRCLLHVIKETSSYDAWPELFTAFTNPHTTELSAFWKTTEQSKINEYESIELLDLLIRHWQKILTQSLRHSPPSASPAQQILDKLYAAASYPPMPGSTKIFWRTLFLSLKEHQ